MLRTLLWIFRLLHMLISKNVLWLRIFRKKVIILKCDGNSNNWHPGNPSEEL
jgi:hypothetical protein